jgi:hypothetical protein
MPARGETVAQTATIDGKGVDATELAHLGSGSDECASVTVEAEQELNADNPE